MALEPSLWRAWPNELLHLVFARVAEISQLRILCKEWKRNIDCTDSEFNRVLDAVTHRNMFALISSMPKHGDVDEFLSKVCDVKERQWHVYDIEIGYDLGRTALQGADGGLVCGISKKRNGPLNFLVMNPLTKKKTQLPSMGVENPYWLKVLKLTMNRKTKEYKVFVVGSIGYGTRGFFAQVYDSHIKEWTVAEARHGRIIGWDYLSFDRVSLKSRFFCMYNCANGTLQHFNETDIAALGFSVGMRSCALVNDHLFVLHKEASTNPEDLLEDGEGMPEGKYCISEFHLPEKATAWVKLRVHSKSVHLPPEVCMVRMDRILSIGRRILRACNGFLLVTTEGYRYEREAWLYNLATCEWKNLPASARPFPWMLCEVSWSALP